MGFVDQYFVDALVVSSRGSLARIADAWAYISAFIITILTAETVRNRLKRVAFGEFFIT